MLQISQLKLPVGHSAKDLENKIRKTLRLKAGDAISYEILKRSMDGRRKPELYWVYTLSVRVAKEEKLLKAHLANVSRYQPVMYHAPEMGEQEMEHAPVVIGSGPAGLFCALLLTEAGFSPLVIERGKRVEERQQDVTRFWETGILDTQSNVQFGEGGAGTFSDGKLNTAVKDPSGRNHFVLETFVRFGAPAQILYDAKPHIGTDVLARVIANMRNYLIGKGCRFAFESCITDFIIEKGRLQALSCKMADGSSRLLPVNAAVLAIGHSARDTFECLYSHGAEMSVKNFAVGFRVEHPQQMIDEAMYGIQKERKLPASPYKVTANFPNGRGVYSFCMCPGGYVVNASSEQEMTAVNGMSYSGRNSNNANSAIIVSVTPEDFGAADPLAGMRFQRSLERKCYELGKGAIPQQLYGDFCQKTASSAYGDFASETRGRRVLTSLQGLMTEDMERSFQQGMEHFGHIIKDFDRKDAILSGMESRTSSPLRIWRNDNYESSISGLYPCGEGAGYAGGITSAAMDGLRVAEAIISKYKAR